MPPTTPARALGVFVLSVLVLLSFGPVVAALGLPGYVVLQAVGFAAPPMIMAYTRGGWREDLGLRAPSRGAWLGAIFVGLGLWALVLGTLLRLQEWLFPIPPSLIRDLEALAAPDEPLWLPVLCVALAPAIGEELLCRGLLLRAFARRWGPIAGILLSAAAFALLHVSPYRFVPTFVLGAVLGTLAIWSGSIVPAMIVHFLNNAAVIVVGSHVDDGSPLVPLLGGTTVLTGVALSWLSRLSRDTPFVAGR